MRTIQPSRCRTPAAWRFAIVVLTGLLLAAASNADSAERALDDRLRQALADVDQTASSSTTSTAERNGPDVSSAVPVSVADPLPALRTLLGELERREALQQKAFETLAASVDSELRGRLEQAQAAQSDTHGRLLRIVRDIVRALEARANNEASTVDVDRLTAEAREILEKLKELERREPISAGELKVRAPQLNPGAPARGATSLAAADAGPTAGDLPGAETTVPRALQEAAAPLAGPIEIYEWVRNNIQPEFYHGQMKGPLQTYLEGSGNDADTAGLLIALLRTKGFPARYARGTVEIPGPTLVAITGAASVESAVRVLVRAGIPHQIVFGAGSVATVRVERVWAEAYVPYDNYRGTGLDPRGKVWVPLDAGFKRLGAPTGIDVVRELGLDARGLLDEYLSTPRTTTPVEFVRGKVTELLRVQRPGTAYADVLNRRTLVIENLGILPGALPYKMMARPEVGAELPHSLIHRVRIVGTTEQNETLIDADFATADLLGRRLTVAYVPATRADAAVVRSYGGLLRTPSYLVSVRPVLKSRGVPLVAGSPIMMGRRLTLRIEVMTPGGTEVITNTAIAGNLTAIGLGGREVTGTESAPDTAGEILSSLAWTYLDRWNRSDAELASLLHVVPVRPTISVCLLMSDLKVFSWGPSSPYRTVWQGLLIDADLRATAPAAVADREREKPFLLLSGLEGSILENKIFEDVHALESVSTAKALQLARAQGVEVRDFIGSDAGLESLPLDTLVKAEIREAVAQGFLARVPVANVTHRDWNGVGYILLDEETGESAYQLQGGHSGGSTAVPLIEIPTELRDPIINQGEEPAPEGAPVDRITKFETTDFQEGVVNQPVEKLLTVLVTDTEGRVVPNAPVTFTVVGGGGLLVDPILGQGVTELVVLSDPGGQAAAQLILGDKTSALPRLIQLEGDENVTQVGMNLVAVRSGDAALADPFRAFGYPDDQFDGTRRHATLQLLRGGGQWCQVPNLRAAGTFMWVSVLDPHGNPLSNIPVRFAYWPDPIEGTPPTGWSRLREVNDSPGRVLKPADHRRCAEDKEIVYQGECEGESDKVTIASHIDGAAAFPLPGSSPFSYYAYAIGTEDNFYEIPVFYQTWGPLCNGAPDSCVWGKDPQRISGMTFRRVIVSAGNLIEAYPVDGNASFEAITEGLFEKERIEKFVDADGKEHFRAFGNNQWERKRLSDSEVTLEPLTAGTLVPETAESLGDGRFTAQMTMGPTPQSNEIHAKAKIFPWIVPYLDEGTRDVDPAYVIDNGDGTYRLSERVKRPDKFVTSEGNFRVWGIKPRVTSVDPSPVMLKTERVVDKPSLVRYEILPAGYASMLDARQVGFELRVDDEEEAVFTRTGLGPVELYKGLPLPKTGKYTAHVRVFGVTHGPPAPETVDSEPFPVSLTQPVDLDIDSDNNNKFEEPGRTEDEDLIEDTEEGPQRPGKVLSVNTGDTDGDEVPDFADGMDRFEEAKADASERFVPVLLELPERDDLSEIRFKFLYPASDPAGVLREGSEASGYTYTPAPGSIRLWLKDGKQARKVASIKVGGDFVPNDVDLTIVDLGPPVRDRVWKLYLESVAFSEAVADQRIEIVAFIPDEKGGTEEIKDAVRGTAIELRLVEPLLNNEVVPARPVSASHPSPVVTIANAQLTNLHIGDDGTTLLADLAISGQVACAVCDFTPGEQGLLDGLRIFLNGAEDPVPSVPLSMSKANETPSFLRPYELTATFGGVIQGVKVAIGNNTVRIETADKVHGITGYAEVSIAVIGTPPPSVVVDYRVTLEFGDARTLADLTPSRPIRLTVVDKARQPDATYTGDVFRNPSDAALVLTNADARVVIYDPAALEAALSPGRQGAVEASILLWGTTPAAAAYVLEETSADSGMFRRRAVHLDLERDGPFAADTPDQVEAEIDDGRLAPISATLTETGSDTRVFASADGTFVVRVLSQSVFGVATLEVAVSSAPLGIDGLPLLAVETSPGSGTFETHEADVYAPEDFTGWTFAAGVTTPGSASTGGELHVYMLQLRGPEDFVSQIDHVETADGPRKVRRAFDGNYYVFMKNSPPLPMLVVPLSAGMAGIDDPITVPPAVADSARFAWGYVKGFVGGGFDLVEGTIVGIVKLAGFAILEGARLSPAGFIYVMTWGDKYESELKVARGAKDLALKLAEIQMQINQDQGDFIIALLSADTTAISAISAPYLATFEIGVELLKGLAEEYAFETPPEKQGQILGRAVFEIAAFVVPVAKAGQLGKLTKLEALTQLRAMPFFRHAKVAKAFDRIAVLLADLARTRMCFVAGTQVRTDDGLKNIEDIRPGDRVLSRDPTTKTQAYRKVLRTVVTHPTRLYRVKYRPREQCSARRQAGRRETSGTADADGEDASEPSELVSTGPHPFFLVGRDEFVPADQLKIGDVFALAEGGTADVVAIGVDDAQGPESFTTYNFDVEDFHTYFVGREGVWVHNAGTRDCQRVYAVFDKIRRSKYPADPVEAFQHTLRKLPKASQEVKSSLVDGVLDELVRMKDAGTLDRHLVELGTDPIKGFEAGREAFVGGRFEKLMGKRLRRATHSGEDYIDEVGQAWDAFGPPPTQYYKWEQIRKAIDKHYDKQRVNTVFDLAGLTPGQKLQIQEYVRGKFGPAKKGFEFLLD